MVASHNRASVSISIDGLNRFKRAVKGLQDMQATTYRTAMEAIGHDLEQEVRVRAPGAMAERTSFVKLLGSGANTRALVTVDHPGATSMEFGRTYDKRHGKLPRGQQARPFAGIKEGDQAVGAVLPKAKAKIWAAIQQDFSDAFAGSDD